MKIWYSPASPFVRKVMVTAFESGQALEIFKVNTNVVASDRELRARNPLGKVPALELDDGRILFDSRVICAYLVSGSPDSSLSPDSPDNRFAALVLEALADGIMDAAVATRYEQALRPEQFRWQGWVDGQMLKVTTGLDSLESDWVDRLGGNLSIGVIAVGCALGYLDFRFGDLDWRTARPRLAEWFAEFSGREAMANTTPAT